MFFLLHKTEFPRMSVNQVHRLIQSGIARTCTHRLSHWLMRTKQINCLSMRSKTFCCQQKNSEIIKYKRLVDYAKQIVDISEKWGEGYSPLPFPFPQCSLYIVENSVPAKKVLIFNSSSSQYWNHSSWNLLKNLCTTASADSEKSQNDIKKKNHLHVILRTFYSLENAALVLNKKAKSLPILGNIR